MNNSYKTSWTKEEIHDARNINLEEYFGSNGYTLERNNNRFYVKEFNGLVLDKCTYYDFYGRNTNHNTAIDCLMNILGYTFNEAMTSLMGRDIIKITREGSNYTTSRKKNVNVKKILCMPEKFNGQYKRIYAYLMKKRQISSKLISYLIRNDLLYQDKKGNCVFVWYDFDKVVGADLNGTSDYRFKGIASGSDQKVGFNICLTNKVEKLMFFESPIEILSYLLIKRSNVNKHTKYISLSGCKDIVVNYHVAMHPDADVLIATNNDKVGKAFADKFNFNTVIPQKHTDWNDVLVAIKSNI